MSLEVNTGLPATTQLLTDGGDVRIQLDGQSGLNQYGCPPYPDTGLVALGSSTASVISEQGFAAADHLRDRLLSRSACEPVASIYARELDRLRDELKQLCGIPDLSGVDVVFAASGTDAHLIAAQIIDHAVGAPLCAIMVEAAETGSGVAAALSGRHFSSRTALGALVPEAMPLAERTIVVKVVSIRLINGCPRPSEEVDAEIAMLASAALAQGQHVLLTLVDVSKTGLIAPSPACVAALYQAYPEQLTVLVDACQFRISPATLRAYLHCGYMVAITGSKFMTGPSFSGALLLPPVVTQRVHRIPATLLHYSAAGDWPPRWQGCGLNVIANVGLLLRWEAALTEMRAFYAMPAVQVGEFLQQFADAILHRLECDPLFQLLPGAQLDRSSLVMASGWDSLPTIFPFLLCRARYGNSRVPLNREETAAVYRRLQQDMSHEQDRLDGVAPAALRAQRFQLGQPVLCGSRDGVPVSALRLCVSARSVVSAMGPTGLGIAGVIAQAMAALDKITWLIRVA
ncbi:MAG: hypothetical protein M0Z83_03000 [Betaproteobacteria bacterium]|nr:hypothetical protein [Betaproteobacteria bacterium]